MDFNVLSHLVRYIRLRITFLFVVPRFRYPFLSPLPHDSQAWESLLGSPVAGAHGGLSPQMFDMPIVHTKRENEGRSLGTRSLFISLIVADKEHYSLSSLLRFFPETKSPESPKSRAPMIGRLEESSTPVSGSIAFSLL